MPPDPAGDLVDAILAETNELIPTRHYDQCEAMTDEGRVAWRHCGCRRRQAARQAAALLRWAADHAKTFAEIYTWPEGGPIEDFAAHLRELADQLDPEGSP